MQLIKLVIKGFKKFSEETTFDFSQAKNTNTISGKNGSGKTTIADSLLLVQQAYFFQKLQSKFPESNFTFNAKEFFLSKLNDTLCARTAAITVDFILEDTTVVVITLNAEVTPDTINWNLSISPEDVEKLDQYWNLENPTEVIVFIESNKHYNETNTPFSELNITTRNELALSRESWLTLNMIFSPRETFHLLYKNLLMDYAYERLIPTKGKQDLYFKLATLLFKQLFPHISFSNFSLNNFRPDEIVNLVTNSETGGKKYDMRHLSAGEKTVFYLFLYLNLVGRISILLVDEPENHLHEDLICKFAKLLNQLCNNEETYIQTIKKMPGSASLVSKVNSYLPITSSNKISQTFFFTHSKVLIMSLFNIGSNFALENTGLTLLQYETCEKKLRELGVSSLYSKILFVEGEQEIELLTPMCQQHNVTIEKIGNCERLIEIYTGIKEVEQHIHNQHFVFLLDRDVTNDERVQAFIDNPEFILLGRHEIENYLLDNDVWLKAAKNLAAEPDSITHEIISTILKQVADQQIPTLKKLYLNNKVRNDILDYHINVKHRDIPVDTEASYTNYINNLLSEDQINSLKDSAIQRFQESEAKYDQSSWDWICLCPGKQVLNIASTEVGRILGITQERFKKELLKVSLSEPSSPYNILLNLIKQKLSIN
ncbi:AAA family ATPase [Paenibacillus sp. Marseille-Q4541]|uniref:AAA family ATPase n=1 Tax=Paenibacillus sp. Marseille-Q4541 TaxID=2831522 RepID=UPI001BA53010|nr:AAA family ATPase [Paenibacillus sp. Marseille-Q4541]